MSGRSLRWALPALFAIAVLPIACDDDASTASSADPTMDLTPAELATEEPSDDPGGTPAAEGATCSPARPREPGASNETFDFEGEERTYVLHVPPAYEGDAAMPLVLNLHGLGSDSNEQDRYSQLPAKADEEGFVLVTPQGQGPIGFWNISPGTAGFANDVAFLGGLLDALEEQLCIDQARVYSTGISNGGLMSSRLGCDLSERIAAFASIAGITFAADCAPAGPVSVLAFHGVADPIIPFEGGPLGIEALSNLSFPAVRESVGKWAAQDACDTAPEEEQVSEHVTLERYAGCAEGADVVLYVISEGGHTWPGAPVDVASLGVTTREIKATDLLWEFFAAHPKP
ncbi:MAG: PHB depolymerase family esterase [Dehalococcoidia bacterium]